MRDLVSAALPFAGYSESCDRGLVEIRRGKGTFVAAPKITQELTELSGFVRICTLIGRKPTARVSVKMLTADANVAISSR